MDPLPWVGLAVAGLVAGSSLAGLLVVRRSYEMLMLASGSAAVAAASFSLWDIVTSHKQSGVMLAALLIGTGAFVGGFGLVSALITTSRMCGQDRDSLPAPHPDRVAVIMLADTEPPAYCPGDVAGEIVDLVDAGIPEAGIGATPFLYAAQKARYRAVGDTSPELEQARALCERVEALLDPSRFGPVYLERCTDGTSLPSAVARLVERGHRSIVIATMQVAESFRIDREENGVTALHLDPELVSISHTQPLWASDRLAQLVASRVLAVTPEPHHTGVALVMHGQPGDRERTHSTFDIQENAFANRVKLVLAEAGISPGHIKPCWQDWRAPDVTETVRHLAALACSRIVVAPACYPFENLSTLLDMPVAIRQARVGEEVSVVQVTPWRDDTIVAEVIASEIVSVANDAPEGG